MSGEPADARRGRERWIGRTVAVADEALLAAGVTVRERAEPLRHGHRVQAHGSVGRRAGFSRWPARPVAWWPLDDRGTPDAVQADAALPQHHALAPMPRR